MHTQKKDDKKHQLEMNTQRRENIPEKRAEQPNMVMMMCFFVCLFLPLKKKELYKHTHAQGSGIRV
jgi:hypothetical protein